MNDVEVTTVIDNLPSIRHFLIFKDSQNIVIRVEKETLEEIQAIITEYKMAAKSFFIIKGEKIV